MTGTVPAIPPATATHLRLEREFDAPREVVWRFFTDPAHVSWFGPHFVHVDPGSVVVEPVPGGRWELDMVDDATGAHYPMRATVAVALEPSYLELALPEIAPEGGPGVIALWFGDVDGRTRLTLHQGPLTDPERAAQTRAGWIESFSEIDELLDPDRPDAEERR